MIALVNLTKNDPKPPIRKREVVKKHKFKVGDRVVYNAVEFGNTDLDGKIGTIRIRGQHIRPVHGQFRRLARRVQRRTRSAR